MLAIASVPESGFHRKTGKPENRKTGKPENRKTGKPENRKTGKPENRNTHCVHLNDSALKQGIFLTKQPLGTHYTQIFSMPGNRSGNRMVSPGFRVNGSGGGFSGLLSAPEKPRARRPGRVSLHLR
jgi:hypothetical protein